MPQTLNLIEHLQQIPDYRKGRGRRHSLWLVLMLVLLGSLCGDRGYRPLTDFSHLHWSSLCELLELPSETRIRSYSTFRRVLQRVNFEGLIELFNRWSRTFIEVSEPTWVALDGKSIKSTLTDYSASYQNFVMTVCAFTHQSGIVLHLQTIENQHTSELEVVRQSIAALSGASIVFTFDALHCQKKRSNSSSGSSRTI
ncbi:MAG: ISAs1 family transposase [Microcoleus sp. SIO2G3]|nr:ISAs1 family transposase [Microcoleus sp. SIO2G3]